jgi:hypothetical protein
MQEIYIVIRIFFYGEVLRSTNGNSQTKYDMSRFLSAPLLAVHWQCYCPTQHKCKNVVYQKRVFVE